MEWGRGETGEVPAGREEEEEKKQISLSRHQPNIKTAPPSPSPSHQQQKLLMNLGAHPLAFLVYNFQAAALLKNFT